MIPQDFLWLAAVAQSHNRLILRQRTLIYWGGDGWAAKSPHPLPPWPLEVANGMAGAAQLVGRKSRKPEGSQARFLVRASAWASVPSPVPVIDVSLTCMVLSSLESIKGKARQNCWAGIPGNLLKYFMGVKWNRNVKLIGN